MTRHLIFSLLTAVAAIAPSPPSASAQRTVGSWESVASYGDTPKRVIDTADKVFVLAQNNLSSFDKNSNEIFAYGKTNVLNDGKINDIFYNHEGKYLLISYTNDNIDIITADGRTINFPELMNAQLTVSKKINNVAFSGDRAYLATEFGLMVINVKKEIVEETGIYGFAVNSVAVSPDRIFIGVRSGSTGTWSAPIGGSHTRFSAFTKCWNDFVTSMEALSSTKILGVGNNAGILTYDPDNDRMSWKAFRSGIGSTRPQRTRDGGYMIHDAKPSFVIFIDKDGQVAEETSLPAEATSNAIASYRASSSEIWLANAEGYGLYDTGKSAFIHSRMRPSGTSGPNVGHIIAAPDGSLYMMTTGEANDNTLAYRQNVFMDCLTPEGRFINISPKPALTYGYKPAVDPSDPQKYLLAMRRGLISVDSDGSYTIYNKTNSCLQDKVAANVYMITDVTTDANGDIWALTHANGKSNAFDLYHVKADKWAAGPEPDDWEGIDVGELATAHSSSILAHSSGAIIYSGHANIGIYDGKRFSNVPQKVDADGMSITGNYVFDMEEDHNGQVWLATSDGVRVIRDPMRMFDPNWVINRPKVARNDGTNLADFLLDKEVVTDVSVDANNNKWFATAGSGLYRSNPDGTEILDHFTAENSGLISDVVYSVYADPNSNDVYVGTNIGLCIYHSTTAPAADDYSDVYAYPNPVTPDYTGLISITGLKDKSLVKIADSAGNVFHQTVSEGGMVVWDGCDASGSRVKSGVYYVLASDGSSDAVVTKILVIN